MATELREINGTIAVHTKATLVERRLKKLKGYLYSIPYYDSHNGKIIGVDMFFDPSARNILRKVIDENQLPLF